MVLYVYFWSMVVHISGHFEMCRELYSMFWLVSSFFFESERHIRIRDDVLFFGIFLLLLLMAKCVFFFRDDMVYGVNSGEVEGDQS